MPDSSQATTILITLVVYKLTLIVIGLWASRRVHDQTDFFLGGRQLGAWVAGLSYAASTSSAWVLLGYSGFVYATGVAGLWMLPGVLGGYVVVWLWFGPRLRADAQSQRLVTPTEFVSAGVSPTGQRQIALLATLLIGFCFVFYIAAQFDAAATAFVSHFDMSFNSSVILGAVIILVYCLLGGFWAASVTDTLQGAIMMLAAIVVPGAALWQAGGPSGVHAALTATGPSPLLDFSAGMGTMTLLGFIFGIMAIGLGTLGQPHLLARLMAVRGERERRRGFAIAMIWALVVYAGMSTLALAARALTLDIPDGEQLFYIAAGALLPPVLAGIVIAAILSAVMSTVDSLLLAVSAAVAHDLGLARRFAGGELWVSRVVMTAIATAAVALALTVPDTIFNRVLFAWNALGAAFGPVILARVVGREPPAVARIAAIVLGFGLTVVFYSLGNLPLDAGADGPGAALIRLAHAPGDPFERILPWLPALAALWFWPRTEHAV